MTPYPPDRLAESRAKRRTLLGRYALALGVLAIAGAYGLGYSQGLLTGHRETAEICQECENARK